MTARARLHGTTSEYTRGCRCDQCKAAKRAYNRAYWESLGRPPLGSPCTDGKTNFPSQTAAAAHFGVAPSLISYHLDKHGNLSRLGKPSGGRTGGGKTPVQIGPRKWPSKAEFFRYLGVTDDTGRGWFRQSKTDRILAALMAADARRAT
ncbi:hypothetical protein [uncultured Paracoccus sp.]|uniref:hypothetical protein n=1 Tax=uncultured Paracoccus sp. TaxID=189685 RepID=UPI0025F46F40|nr:hypothetical protein [uncultured Paracoccus sp.]